MSSDSHATAYKGFFQLPPTLSNPFTTDPLLHRILRHHLPPPLLSQLTPTFTALGAQSISAETISHNADVNQNLPSVKHWDGWGSRKDELLTSEGWKKLKGMWASSGLMKDFYSRQYGAESRIVGFTKYVLF